MMYMLLLLLMMMMMMMMMMMLSSIYIYAGVMYHGPDTRYSNQELCLVFTGRNIQILDVTDKCDIIVVTSTGYVSKAYAHQGWWSEDHSYFVMGDEHDELRFRVRTRSLLWDASDLRSLFVVHDYRSFSTKAVGEC
jgi:hypothetical protein